MKFNNNHALSELEIVPVISEILFDAAMHTLYSMYYSILDEAEKCVVH